MVLLISYDLNRHERPAAYQRVREVIERNAIGARKPLYSQWLVETNESVATWSDRLQRVLDGDDKLLIVSVTQPVNGWLPQETWDWLNSRI